MADIFSTADEQLKKSLSRNQAPGTLDSVVPDALAELVGKSMQQVNESNLRLQTAAQASAAVVDKAGPEIDSALANLDKIRRNPFAEIVGIFDPSYDEDQQRATLQAEALKVQMAQTRVQASKEIASVERDVAMAPLQAATTLLTLQQQMQQGQVTNLALGEKLGEMQLANVTDVGAMRQAVKTGDYSKLGPNVQPRQVRDYLLQLETSSRNAQAAALAMQSGQLKLHNDLLAASLDNLPGAVAQQLVTQAQAAGTPYVELAKGVKVPIEKVQEVAGQRLKQSQDSQAAFATVVQKLAGLEVAAGQVTAGLNRVGSATNGTRVESKPPEAAKNQLFGGVNTAVLPLELQGVVEKANAESEAIINSVTDPVARASALVDIAAKVQTQYDAYVKKEVDSAPKEVQPAYQDFFSKGVVTNVAAASDHITKIMQVPNLFTTNPALNSAWSGMVFNVAKELDKDTGSLLMRKDGKVDSAAVQAALFETLNKKKVDPETVIRKALTTPNAAGNTPVDQYVNIHTEILLGQSLGQLATQVDSKTGAVNPLFAGLYDPVSGWSSEIAPPTPIPGMVRDGHPVMAPQFSAALLARTLEARVQKAQAAGSKVTFEEAINTFSNAIKANTRQYAEQYMLPATPEEGSFTVLLDGNNGPNLLWSRMQDIFSTMKTEAAVAKQDRKYMEPVYATDERLMPAPTR